LTWDPVIFGRLLSTIRDRRRLSQEGLADAVGIGQSTLSRLESGTAPTPPRIDTLLALEHTLGRPPLSLAATTLGLDPAGERPDGLLEAIRLTDELSEPRRQVLFEMAELMLAKERQERG
jgi:transcriptional regulator with XRE-family HTH domain